MRKSLILTGALLAALPVLALAQEKAAAPAAAPGGETYFEATQTETENLKILKISAADRVVTLHSEHGDTLEVECGPEVKNFAQLKVGDDVTATYNEKLTVSVEKSGEVMDTKETMTAQAKPGEKPRAAAMERTQVRAKIVAIDKTKGTATLQGHDGEPFTVTPLVRANLDRVEVGNIVVFTHTVANAISVTKAKPKAKTESKPKSK